MQATLKTGFNQKTDYLLTPFESEANGSAEITGCSRFAITAHLRYKLMNFCVLYMPLVWYK